MKKPWFSILDLGKYCGCGTTIASKTIASNLSIPAIEACNLTSRASSDDNMTMGQQENLFCRLLNRPLFFFPSFLLTSLFYRIVCQRVASALKRELQQFLSTASNLHTLSALVIWVSYLTRITLSDPIQRSICYLGQRGFLWN